MLPDTKLGPYEIIEPVGRAGWARCIAVKLTHAYHLHRAEHSGLR